MKLFGSASPLTMTQSKALNIWAASTTPYSRTARAKTISLSIFTGRTILNTLLISIASLSRRQIADTNLETFVRPAEVLRQRVIHIMNFLVLLATGGTARKICGSFTRRERSYRLGP